MTTAVREDWLAAPEFERLAQVITRMRFLERPDLKAIAKESAEDRRRLGLIPGTEEQYAQFNVAVQARQHALRSLPYPEYLRTAHWQTVRAGALTRADHACQVCSTTERLHVHHRSYDYVGDEYPQDVTVLCAACHRLFHENGELAR